MNNLFVYFYIFLLSSFLHAQMPSANETNSIKENAPDTSISKTNELELIPFTFNNKNLLEIINYLQKLKNVNIIISPAYIDNIKQQTVTFTPAIGDSVTLQAAWELLNTFLDLAGYSIIQGNSVYTITKNDERLVKEVLPVYIVPPTKLPYSEMRIRYMYYFKNLKLSDEQTNQAIKTILKEMLSPQQLVLDDPKANAIIITDKSDLISSAMRIISELDASGFKETIEVIPLYYATASDVKSIFEALRLAANPSENPMMQAQFLRGDAKAEMSSYFPAGTIIQADGRTNSLIVMGRESAVARIQNFIEEFIDLPPAGGKSILHVIDLQYLDAQEFAVTLNNIVNRQNPMMDQSRGPAVGTGPERFFTPGIIIKAEPTISTEEKIQDIRDIRGRGEVVNNAKTLADAVYSGGNRLLVAALHEDWVRIKELTDKLDTPQRNVICDVYIADINVNKNKLIGGTTRNLLDCNVDNYWLDFLSSQLSATSAVLPTTSAAAGGTGTLAADLLGLTPSSTPPTFLNPTISTPGSLIVSFNEQCTGVWSLLRILDTIAAVNVISRPHIITLDNTVGTVSESIIRRALGQPYASTTGVPVTPFVDVYATILVQIKPRTSSENRLSLQIAVNISQFVTEVDTAAEASKNRIERGIQTNANLNSGQVLVLGGLTRKTLTDDDSKTPILGDIPIIGTFFSRKQKREEVTNIAVFIAPTIVEPKLRGGQNAFTSDKLREARNDYSDDLTPFNNYKDPITRFFFKDVNDGDLMTQEYLSRATNGPAIDEQMRMQYQSKRPIKILTRENSIIKPGISKAELVKQLVA